MGFRINHNIPALTATGNLRISQQGLGKSIERLSSGLRINRGADDAAGLTVSEKLRGQITGLSRATANAQDGISLIQTAEGALNEDHSILNRMRELSIQSQSDALTANDRLEIQKEVDQMVEEIDRISQTTEFNTKKQLDGSMSALVSTDNNDIVAFTTGGQVAAGDYKVSLTRENAGVRQVQQSGIQKDKDTGNVAGLATKLGDLESMFDSEGNSRLETPQTITVRGNGQSSDVIVSSDLTLEEFAGKLETAITSSTDSGGLGITGSTFAYNASNGQFVYEAGRDGSLGDLSLSADEGVLQGLAMQVQVESEDAAFKVTATEVGVASPTTVSENTTSARASGVIGGMDLQFELASEARIDGTIAATDSVTVAGANVVFTIHDTNSTDNGQDPTVNATSAGVTITLTQSRTYTTASISTMINNAVAAANNPLDALTPITTSTSFQNPGLTASFDGFNLTLSSSVSGTSGEISILGNQAAQDVLGIVDGKVTGSGGTNATIAGSTDISSGITIAGTGVTQIQIGDGDFNQGAATTPTNISFAQGVAISSTSVVDTFNSYFTTNNVKINASLTSDGKLELRSTETGGDAKISITAIGGNSLASLGLVGGATATGAGGNAAVYNGTTADSQATQGFTLNSPLSFTVTDKNGATTGNISIVTANVSTSGESFTISKEAVTSILSNSSLSTTDVSFQIDAGNRLDFFSRSAGDSSRIALAVTGSGSGASAQATTGQNAFGMDFRSASQGDGKTEFDLHVTDKTLRFEVGANQKQFMAFQVRNASADSLGLKGVDVTNISAATKALGKIDDAINAVSSERAKLGAVQNRLNSTVNNLTTTHTNLSQFESNIRDVDLAKETVEFTRNQILTQAGTAQLAQAKAIPQVSLQLLG
jgi:flagellin